VIFVEGAIGPPDGEDQVEKFAHAVSEGNVTPLAFGPEEAVEGAHGWGMTDGDARSIPKVATQQVAAFARHLHRAGGQRVAPAVYPRAVFLGKNAEVADELFWGGEPVDVDDLGDQRGGRGLADTGDRQDVGMGRAREFGEGFGQQFLLRHVS